MKLNTSSVDMLHDEFEHRISHLVCTINAMKHYILVFHSGHLLVVVPSQIPSK